MLSFFRSNQFFVAVPLALYILLVHLGALLGHVQPVEHTTEAGLLYESWFGWTLAEPFYAALIASALVFIQAVTINVLADEFRLMGDRNWFPGLFYALVASSLPDFLFVSPPLVAATFLPFALWAIYKAFQKPNMEGAILDAGLWIAVSSLFYPPSIFLIVAGFAGLEVVRVFRLHEWFVFLIGAFVPLFLGWLWYFWADQGSAFRDAQWGDLFQLYRFDVALDEKVLLKTVFIVLLTFVFLFGLGSLYSRKGIQAQKFVTVLYWFLLVGGLSVLLRPVWHWEHLILPTAAMGILLSLTFQSIKNRMWAELWHLGLLVFIVFIQFADFFLSLLYSVI